MSDARVTTRHKERVTLSLTHGAMVYVRDLCKRTKSPSVSALFERIIENLRRRTEMAQLNANAVAYYDSLPEAQVAEDAGWGQLGELSFGADKPELVVDTEIRGASSASR
jgi:hypothetical protein